MADSLFWQQTAGEVFNQYSSYLKQIYGEAVYRVSVDAGFSCPNRGDNRQAGGCLYCDSRGSRAPYLGNREDMESQVMGSIGFLKKRYGARQFILYFQAFSGTYAPPARLREIYDHALSLTAFKELIVSTRPDCIDEQVVALLAGYQAAGLTTWVELGLQSAADHTLQRINRGHTVAQFLSAFHLLKKAGIKTAVHVIFGLPGEGEGEWLATIRFLAALKPEGIKIHNLHIVYDTPLFTDFLKGELLAPGYEQHLTCTMKALELLPPETVIMRLTCDTPRQLLASPRFFPDKASFYRQLRQTMLLQQTRQGRCFAQA